MAKNRVSLGVDTGNARRVIDDAGDAIDDGAWSAVRQLAVLAEGAMKDEAPEGAGRDKHLRDTVDTRFMRQSLVANVGPRKRADDGVLLAKYIVEGTDPSSYTEEPPPIAPLMDWAAAKLGDSSAAWALQQSIFEGGHDTLPNDFVNDSLDQWENQVEAVAGDQVRDALSRLMRGGR